MLYIALVIREAKRALAEYETRTKQKAAATAGAAVNNITNTVNTPAQQSVSAYVEQTAADPSTSCTSTSSTTTDAIATTSSASPSTVSGSLAIASKRSRRQAFLGSRKPPQPKPAGEDDKQQDVAAVFQKLLSAESTDTTAARLSIFTNEDYACLKPLVLQLFSAPASSAPSERVFSQAGQIMKPTRSRLSKTMLSKLVFLKCNMRK